MRKGLIILSKALSFTPIEFNLKTNYFQRPKRTKNKRFKIAEAAFAILLGMLCIISIINI